MFVRYVSHEIRTPLNTASLGLQYLKNEMKDIQKNNLNSKLSNELESTIAVVDDVQFSCEVAVSILNDLLTYEKLEGNILQTQMKEVNIWNLVLQCIRPFLLQVASFII